MQFNDTTNGQGLVQDAYFRVGLDATQGPISYPINDLVRNANNALDDAVGIILGSDGRWQFDDTNYTTLPIGTTDLVTGQKDYTFDPKYLDVISVEVKDIYGNWYQLTPFDIKDVPKGMSLTDYFKTPGAPLKYDKIGNSIVVYPGPNYSQLQSLKVYFQRKMDRFVAADTIKEPGFNQNLHKYISVCMAYDYACLKSLPQMPNLLAEKQSYEGSQGKIAKAYNLKSKDEKPRLKSINRPKI